MPLDEFNSLPPKLQLVELEHAYAECLADGDREVLATLWNKIKELRLQLGLPLYIPPKKD